MQTIETTNQELLDLLRGLQETRELKGSPRFSVVAARNLKILERHLKSIDEMAFPSPEFQELSIKAQKLIEKEDSKALEELEAEHANVVDARKEQLANVQKELEKETEIQLHTISEDNLPSDISTEEVLKIMIMIK